MFCPHVLGNEYIFKHGQVAEQTDVLEGPGNPQPGNLVRRLAHRCQGSGLHITCIETAHLALGRIRQYDLAVKGYRAIGGLVDTGDTVEGGCLSSAVGTDEGHDLVFIYIQRQSVHSNHAAKLHGHMIHMKYILNGVHYCAPPFFEAEAFFFFPFSLWGMPLIRRNSPSQENSLFPMMPRL